MAGGFKRGGFGGSASSGFKKGYTKKRSSEEGTDTPLANKKSKVEDEEDEEAETPVVPKLQIDEDGNPFVGLNHSGKRRITVSEFKGMTFVNIREYWVNDAGELKPGKKGISLSIEQYSALLAAAPLLESVLSKKDIHVTRPHYDADLNTTEAVEDEKEKQQSVVEGEDET
ncbi:transcriptional Coactivator p15 [Stagonosporopsis vannaccii]|nr:transcriptional Coactivator p15 [Stagonosporopsis vannaccii]